MLRKLKIYYQNFNGVQSKLLDIRRELTVCDYDIICGTESKLQNDVSDSELCPIGSHFKLYRKDRNLAATGKKSGGGCLAMVRTSLSSNRVLQFEALTSNEELWLCIDLGSGYKLYLCIVYLKPSSTLQEYLQFFDNVTAIKNDLDDKACVKIVGDFNLPMMSWVSDNGSYGLVGYEGRIAEAFVQFLCCNDFVQMNGVMNGLGRTLDLAITDLPSTSVKVVEAEPICKVDRHHPPLYIELNIAPVRVPPQHEVQQFNYRRGDYAAISRKIESVNWWSELNELEVDHAVERFYSILRPIIESHVPLRPRRDHKYPIWFTRELIALVRRKEKAHKKFKKSRSQSDYRLFSQNRKQLKALMKSCEKSYLDNLQSLSVSQVKPFWSYAKSLRKSNTYPNEIRCEDIVYKGPTEMCEGFATYFDSVHAPVDDSLPHYEPSYVYHDAFNFVPVSEDDVSRVITTLKADKGMGHDGISNFFIKKTAKSISLPLSIIIARMVSTSCYPKIWKLGNWAPIPKDGSGSDMSGFRGVAVLCGFNQVVEKLLHEQLMSHCNKFIHPRQHGFLKFHSTQTNLVEFVQAASNAVDSGGQVDVIYLDIAKAFDRVPHRLLIQKLVAYGFTQASAAFMSSYLRDRAYQVKLNGATSRRVQPTSGVGQGSVLGPPLFLIFFNDVLSEISSDVWAFADDIKVVKNIDTVDDVVQLQQDVERVNKWCGRNGLALNTQKSRMMSFTRKKLPIVAQYSIDGEEVVRVTEMRDLGVTMDSKLSFDVHVDNVVKKAAKMMGFVMRLCKPFHMLKPIVSLFNQLVRPSLEYCSTAWNPYYVQYSDRLEAIQHAFTRYLYRKFHYPYEPYNTRLQRLGMCSLLDRREVADMLFLHKLVHSNIKCSLSNEICYRFPTHGIREVELFHLPKCRTNLGKASPMYRMCATYNKSFSDFDVFLSYKIFSGQVKDFICND